MWRVALSLANPEMMLSGTHWHAVYSKNIDDYEVQGYGQEGGGSEVLWGARVLCEFEVGRDVW